VKAFIYSNYDLLLKNNQELVIRKPLKNAQDQYDEKLIKVSSVVKTKDNLISIIFSQAEHFPLH